MFKPVRHEHAIEITIDPEIKEKVIKARDHLEENKRPYLYGVCGMVIGAVGMRLISRKSAIVQVVVQQTPTAE